MCSESKWQKIHNQVYINNSWKSIEKTCHGGKKYEQETVHR